MARACCMLRKGSPLTNSSSQRPQKAGTLVTPSPEEETEASRETLCCPRLFCWKTPGLQPRHKLLKPGLPHRNI